MKLIIFIEVYNNSVIERMQCFWGLVLWSDLSPRKLGDQIPTKELGPKNTVFVQ